MELVVSCVSVFTFLLLFLYHYDLHSRVASGFCGMAGALAWPGHGANSNPGQAPGQALSGQAEQKNGAGARRRGQLAAGQAKGEAQRGPPNSVLWSGVYRFDLMI